MLHILTLIAPLFIVILIAALIQKFFGKQVDHWSKALNEYALYIGLPVLIFSVISKSEINFSKEAPLLLVNSLFILLSFTLALLTAKIFKLKKQDRLTLFICLAFSNIAYLGIPVLTATLGQQALPQISLIVATYIFWQFTLGTGYLNSQNENTPKTSFSQTFKNLFKNPLLLSVILAVTVSLSGLKVPTILQDTLEMLSASVTPTVLIVIGLFIGKMELGKAKDWLAVIIFSLTTTIIMPAIFFFILQAFGTNPGQYTTSILEAAMPLAITPFALAEKYQLNKAFIARSVMLSTALAPFTLSAWIMALS